MEKNRKITLKIETLSNAQPSIICEQNNNDKNKKFY